MRRNLPFSPGVRPGDVWAVAAEAKPHVLARRYNVRTDLMRAYLTGGAEMPLMLYELLAMSVRCKLPSTAGLFAGWTVENGQRFYDPAMKHHGGLHWADIDRMPEYRRIDRVAERQADLIERLIRERDFYKRQCELEARYGILVRSMVDGPPTRR